ncbi:MAG TPA: TetR/AcrR family transcriptional regulator [Caulobacteraceae bacterium]|nr:TetR/AcrR family transcriptional regulator [Caulobacteraceae bacterium]
MAAALELIDARGLAALNMRDLGVALGASTMGVYRHFRNKSELLDAVVDGVVAGFAPPPVRGGWQAQARALSRGVRGAMLAHPELADIIGRELRRSAVSLKVNSEMIQRLRATGVPPALLADAYWAISSYTSGYALLEAQALRRAHRPGERRSRPERAKKLEALLRAVEDIPREASHDAALVLSQPLDDDQFLFGLDCLIRGLEEKVRALTAKDQIEA